MKSTAGLFIRISSEESYAKEVENIRFSCIAECSMEEYKAWDFVIQQNIWQDL